ncbi:MAG: phenylalanine--tRNA ligase subunit beta [Bdellovibrionales bacterium CG10_big_fil_rev_8_21_14_0_10_45_34]|nr:MAG: phenylalanine--tRNA ligase subunit beta [Bdellovibrionales bacterium CG10_big_fil_rev_8_21_14_0_10_45_34]
MKISLNWISKYVDVSSYKTKPEKLADVLTQAGLEVESVSNQRQQFKNVVSGVVSKKSQHPDADRLSVCSVSTGDGREHQIVCGARNHQEGDAVVVALPGAILPGDFEITASKIRAVESNGMLCSAKELGLSADNEGILILPKETKPGEPIVNVLGLDDVFFELKVTPNRADCLSHFGLAREIAALTGVKAEFPIESVPVISDSTRQLIDLQVLETDLCPRYSAVVVKDIKVAPSPQWLRRALESVGVNSINNVVDITNYVMLELGQPLHAFDLNAIAKAQIRVRRAEANEKMVSFDGTELSLVADDLVIADSDRVIALAGVIGAKNSGVTDQTQDVLIESAFFKPSAVRRTSRRLGIETDACYRFSRGVDPEATLLAMNRAAGLLSELAGGQVCDDPYDIYPQPLRPQAIAFSSQTAAERLGIALGDETINGILKRLGCEVDDQEKVWSVLPPAFRHDLNIEMDLVEEVARVHGYDQIPMKTPVFLSEPQNEDFTFIRQRELMKEMSAAGFQEAINFHFVSSKWQSELLGDLDGWQAFHLAPQGAAVAIKNPINEDLDVMRVSLLPGLLSNLKNNFHYGSQEGALYEIGPVFYTAQKEYCESIRLAGVMWGSVDPLWKTQSPQVLDLLKILEVVLQRFTGVKLSLLQSSAPNIFHPYQAARVELDQSLLGGVGSLSPEFLESHKIRTQACAFELDVTELLSRPRKIDRPKPLSKYPIVERDLAFLVPASQPVGEISRFIEDKLGTLGRGVRIFDVFEGGDLESGIKSVGFRMKIQNQEATLSDAELQKLQTELIDSVSQQFQARIR